jgi:hypothetical protein
MIDVRNEKDCVASLLSGNAGQVAVGRDWLAKASRPEAAGVFAGCISAMNQKFDDHAGDSVSILEGLEKAIKGVIEKNG